MAEINRREFVMGALGAAGIVLLSRLPAFGKTIDDRAVKSVSLRVTCRTEFLMSVKKEKVCIWMPVPQNDMWQSVTGFEFSSALKHKYYGDETSAFKLLYLESTGVKKGLSLTMKYNLKRRACSAAADSGRTPKDFLKPSEWEKINDKVAAFTGHLAGGQNDPVKAARIFYDAVIDRINYVHEACTRGVSVMAFEDKAGRSDDYNALFRTMMIHRGIPTVWEQGIALPLPSETKNEGKVEADCINAHSWVSFFAADNKWYPVDLTLGKTRPELRDYCFGNLPPNRIKISVGREITLTPPQKEILNTFAYTYVESNGIPLIYGHHYRNVINYELVGMEI
ncbi:MAG: transglutaminase-like domain-containing protein [Nitrospirae bacterium YQR-1]